MFFTRLFVAGSAALLQSTAYANAIPSNHGSKGPRVHTHGHDFVPDHVLRVSMNDAFQVACQTRPTVVVNGTSPGPRLDLEPGKTSWVRVYNDIPDQNLTMHWHGLSQRTAIFSDGTPSASQWPIAPLHFFDYEIHPEHEDAGTYFYHSHVEFQAVSAHGALIVKDNGPPPYQYDEERVVLLSDYFTKTDSNITQGLTAVPFVWSGEVNSVLINGVGVANTSTAGTSTCQLPVIDVAPGKTYRLRFIGGTALSMVQLGMVGHNFTIIAADGQYTKPSPISYMQLASGQRFDALLTTKSQDDCNKSGQSDYLIQYETKNRPLVYRGYGVLRYNDAAPQITTAPATPPLALTVPTYNYLEYTLQPLHNNNFPSAAEVTRRITIDARQQLTQSIIWRFNGDQWNETTPGDATPSSIYSGDTPYLVAIYENGPAAIPNYDAAMANDGWDPATYMYPAKIGEVIEIIWQNTGSLVKNNGGLDYHPMHAHGRHFYDIGSGNGTYDPVANEARLKGFHPALRDTTLLYKYNSATVAGNDEGWRGWRLRVENPGIWMMHCHILQHMIMGMQSVWAFGDYDQIASIPHYAAAGYLKYGGDAYGNETFAPSYAHVYD